MTAGAWSAVLGNLFHKPKPPMLTKANVVDYVVFENKELNLCVAFNDSQTDYVESIRIDNDEIIYKNIEFRYKTKYTTVDGIVV